MSVPAAALLAALVSVACSRAPDTIPLPAQRRTWSGPPARPFGPFFRASDPHAGQYITDGIERSGDARWRWAARRAEARFWLTEARPYKFALRLFIARQTFEQTGPVTVSCFISGRLLGRFRCEATREFTFEKDVPAAWITTEAPVNVVFETEPVWKNEWAFLLVEAGFRPPAEPARTIPRPPAPGPRPLPVPAAPPR